MSALPPGSLILVTGANGFIGSHISDQLLQKGYRIRGAVRNAAKGRWLQEYADDTHGTNRFELIVVPDMATAGAYDKAIQGCSGAVHVAADLSFDPDPNVVVSGTVSAIESLLRSAAAELSMRRFVYTSSTTGLYYPTSNTPYVISSDMWNNKAIEQAWQPPPYETDRALAVYGASKAQAEQAMFRFAREEKPGFTVNSVIPNTNFGPLLSPAKQPPPSSAKWILNIYKDDLFPTLPGVGLLPPQQAVDVRDTARLHVAALVDSKIQNERLFAIAEPYSWRQVLGILKKIRPKHPWPENVEDQGADCGVVAEKSKMEDILRRNFGVAGFTSLEEMLAAAIEHMQD